MAARKKDVSGSESKAEPRAGAPEGRNRLFIAAAVVLVFAILLVAFVFQYTSPPPTVSQSISVSTFLKSFSSAQRADVAVLYTNSAVLAAGVGCATAIIEEVEANPQLHRNTTTLDFFVINQTSAEANGCVVERGLGSPTANSTNATTAQCLGYTESEPSILIEYNSTNGTSVTQGLLRIHGSVAYLDQCGISAVLGQGG